METCRNCKFWNQAEEKECHHEDQPGTCQRFPPKLNHALILLDAQQEEQGDEAFSACENAANWTSWQQAVTRAGMWCGEWKKKTKGKKPFKPA